LATLGDSTLGEMSYLCGFTQGSEGKHSTVDVAGGFQEKLCDIFLSKHFCFCTKVMKFIMIILQHFHRFLMVATAQPPSLPSGVDTQHH